MGIDGAFRVVDCPEREREVQPYVGPIGAQSDGAPKGLTRLIGPLRTKQNPSELLGRWGRTLTKIS